MQRRWEALRTVIDENWPVKPSGMKANAKDWTFLVVAVGFQFLVSETGPTVFLIGGCNDAGKPTFAKELLPTELKCLRFLNPDEIARRLSPLDPSKELFRRKSIAGAISILCGSAGEFYI
jgi:hypothetical protein